MGDWQREAYYRALLEWTERRAREETVEHWVRLTGFRGGWYVGNAEQRPQPDTARSDSHAKMLSRDITGHG